MHGHKETLHWYGTGYYGLLSSEDGYGGFDYTKSFLYMNQSTWTAPGGRGHEFNWCDTGYQNVLAMGGGTCLGWVYEKGLMESVSHRSFTLESMVAASAWNTNAVWDINSYTLDGHKLVLKASDKLTISQDAEKIDFAKFGHKGDFTNIAAVGFKLVDTGQYGNSCTYHGGRSGFVLCLDAVKVEFSKNPRSGAHIAASLAGHAPHGSGSGNAFSPLTPEHADTGYHSQLLSLVHDTVLTDHLALPMYEHFGT